MAKKTSIKAKANQNSVASNIDLAGTVGGSFIVGSGNTINVPTPDQISPRFLHQLPPSPAGFTGREVELKQVIENLTKNKGTAISGLSGMGGVGKTALGLVATHQIADKYPDAQIFLDLKGVTEPLSPADIMRHIILSFEPTSDLHEYNDNQLAAIYRSSLSGKKALLFLDNALDAAQLRFLIPPDTCSLIVTSRRSFALPGMERPIQLDVLPEKKAIQLLKRLCKRIKGNADEIAKLCGYIPLALQIAGSFLAVNLDWSSEEYSKRLRTERLKLLKSDDDDPKYDLAATIGLSYAQLAGEEQMYWRILSVFPASFRRDAAVSMWELDENITYDLVSKLHRMSLLDYNQKAKRYLLHDLLADYAVSHMDEQEERMTRVGHAQYYLNILQTANQLYLQGKENILSGLQLLDSEWQQITYGQSWISQITDEKDVLELCNEYPNAGYMILLLRLHPRMYIGWLESGLEAARKLDNKEYEGYHLGNLGIAYAALGEARKAIGFYEQRLVIAQEIGDRRGEAFGSWNLGLEYEKAGELEKAISAMQICVDFEIEMGHPDAENDAEKIQELQEQLKQGRGGKVANNDQ